ncbi:MAG: CbbQ/NirQ/NorQ C-terminal domain-containing protein [Candidatus Binatia bacterium]
MRRKKPKASLDPLRLISTRLLIYAGKLISAEVAPRLACQVAVVQALTDDKEIAQSIQEVVEAIFPE